MTRPFQLPDGRWVEVMTPEEVTAHEAAVAASRKASAVIAERRGTMLAYLSGLDGDALVRAFDAKFPSNTMEACWIYEILSNFGLRPANGWPNIITR